MIDVLFKKLCPEAKCPEAQGEGNSGYDLYSIEETCIRPGDYRLIDTGIAIEMPKGIEAQVRPRSGLAAKHGVTVLNAPGTIDSSYRGVIKVILINHGESWFHIRRGARIAQLVFAKVQEANWINAVVLSDTDRGEKGMGSTG